MGEEPDWLELRRHLLRVASVRAWEREDLVQEGLLAIFSRLTRAPITGDRGCLRYGARTIRNAASKAFKKDARALEFERRERPRPASEQSPRCVVEDWSEVAFLLAVLSPAQGAVFHMRALDFEDAEIASRLGCSPATVRKRFQRGREKLRCMFPDRIDPTG